MYGNQFVHVPEMVPEFIVPDLNDCEVLGTFLIMYLHYTAVIETLHTYLILIFLCEYS